jgi:hypothetical protein
MSSYDKFELVVALSLLAVVFIFDLGGSLL